MKRMLDQKQIDQLAELLNGHIPNEKFKELIESLSDNTIKSGYYIWNNSTENLINVEEIPNDYTGFSLLIAYDNDSIIIGSYEAGLLTNSVIMDADAIHIFNVEGQSCSLTKDGVSKINFASLTHSFNELDPTLKQIVLDAINDDNTDGVACSEAQWSAIKSLLDKLLYLNYGPWSLIKVTTDGIGIYVFGGMSNDYGARLSFNFETSTSILYALYEQI